MPVKLAAGLQLFIKLVAASLRKRKRSGRKYEIAHFLRVVINSTLQKHIKLFRVSCLALRDHGSRETSVYIGPMHGYDRVHKMVVSHFTGYTILQNREPIIFRSDSIGPFLGSLRFKK